MVSRDIPVGNGSSPVNFDDRYRLRGLYWPHVAQENHTEGHPFRFGVWVDGRFSWVSDDGGSAQSRWERKQDEPDPERERLVKPVRWAEAEPYTNYILCGCCYSVCPVEAADPEYLGPAALAQHYRFMADVRDGAEDRRLALVGSEHGVGGCDFVWNCVEICPKGVPPTKGIAKTRARITRERRNYERKG